MVEAKKNERANALKEVKHLCKEFGFTAGMLKDSLAEGKKIMKQIAKELIKKSPLLLSIARAALSFVHQLGAKKLWKGLKKVHV